MYRADFKASPIPTKQWVQVRGDLPIFSSPAQLYSGTFPVPSDQWCVLDQTERPDDLPNLVIMSGSHRFLIAPKTEANAGRRSTPTTKLTPAKCLGSEHSVPLALQTKKAQML